MKLFSVSQASASVTTLRVEPAAESYAKMQGSLAESAPAPQRTGPPDTTYYMKLGYIVAGVIFFAYIVLLMRRVASVRKQS